MEKWEEGYYITSVAGSDNTSSLVVMSKGTRFTQQSYKVSRDRPCMPFKALLGSTACLQMASCIIL
jgi:hypothetical protein